jgi:hypothetical protein
LPVCEHGEDEADVLHASHGRDQLCVEEVHGVVRNAKVRRRNARLGNDGIVDASAPRGVAKRH